MRILSLIYPIAVFIAATSCGCQTELADKLPASPTGKYCSVHDGILYSPDGDELALWGVNFQTPISWEVNRLSKAGLSKTSGNLKLVTDNNLEDLELMGVNVLRCHLTPADFTDSDGRLVENTYLDALDYLVSEAPKKGMRLIFAFLNDMGQKGPGSSWTNKGAETWVHDKSVVKCTETYIAALVERVNPYNGKRYGDNPDIALWELMNEPRAYSYQDIQKTDYLDDFRKWASDKGKPADETSYEAFREEIIRNYIDNMVNLLRKQGDGHPVCWSLNWHRYRTGNEDIFRGVATSKADIVSFCNYPGQDYVAQDYWNYRYDFTEKDFSNWFNSYLKKIDGYGWALSTDFKSKAKSVYEFETFFNQSACLYPVQALYFKALRAQTACMWTYTFSEIAEKFGGSHFLNLRCTPGKAAAFIVAGKIFSNTPAGEAFFAQDEMSGEYWRISHNNNVAVYSDGKSWCCSADYPEAWTSPKPSGKESYIAGCGSSPLVKYDGSGLYVIRENNGCLEINLMPDVNVIGDQFASPDYSTVVTELDCSRENRLSIMLDGWKGKKAKIYLEGNSVGTPVEGTADLLLKPGKYIVKPE
ncbi:MAG: cellulase family glycosylhydrolase [Candidatus Cryptobacteroides sp.]